MTAFRVLLLLLLTDIYTTQKITEKPSLAGPELRGRITTSTFALNQPRCIFDTYTNTTDEIWLVVVLTSEKSKFVNPVPPKSLPAYQDFPLNSSYMTLNTARLNYPCLPDSTDITVLRVGSETSCMTDRSRPNCNGPLPVPGPYSVKFLAMDNSQPKAETEWLDDIMLKTAQQSNTIDPQPRRRSASMIVITTILSILLAILLVCFIATLIYVCLTPASSAQQRELSPEESGGSRRGGVKLTHYRYLRKQRDIQQGGPRGSDTL
ncbi:uroplakin-3b isoform X1 [Alligator mississippiensis]|uniref:uroplakin-3b isoform X1 n=1 Tax=Alligator mississippiensis TaxID=8496 RepID=UPI00090769AD|nr:uroplakin-3b isoform X1 [Alligator mississippiensis]